MLPMHHVKAAEVLSQGNYSETANDDGAPNSISDAVGNIRRVNAVHSKDGSLRVTIDFWKAPTANFTTRIRWCAPDAYEELETMNICDPSNSNYLNSLMFFSPAKTGKGT